MLFVQPDICTDAEFCGGTNGCTCPSTKPACVGTGANARCKVQRPVGCYSTPESGALLIVAFGNVVSLKLPTRHLLPKPCAAVAPCRWHVPAQQTATCLQPAAVSSPSPSVAGQDQHPDAKYGAQAESDCGFGHASKMVLPPPTLITHVHASVQPEECTDTDFCTASYPSTPAGCACPSGRPKCAIKLVGQTGTASAGVDARCQVCIPVLMRR